MSEVVNDLYDYGYKIVQNNNYFKFSIDTIALADFISIRFTDKKMLDMCTGNAPIPIILSSKISEIYGMEIQKPIFELAHKSIKINNLDNIKLINDNIKNWTKYFPGNNFNIISCNPPYFKYNNNALVNDNIIKSIARHEITINLEEIIQISYQLLKDRGNFYIVYRPERLIELFDLLKKYNFGLKRIQFCYYDYNSTSSFILIEAMKNGKDNLKIEKPLITRNYHQN